jgi:hypothetical protein
MSESRFKRPFVLREHKESFSIEAANGRGLACVYFNHPGNRHPETLARVRSSTRDDADLIR